jgi:hypothetical protein
MTNGMDNMQLNAWGQGYADKYSKVLPDWLPGPGEAFAAEPRMSEAKEKTPPDDHAIRINCGCPIDFKDQQGRLWLADTYGTGGGIVDRISWKGIPPIARTDEPFLYQTEHWHVQSYAIPVANGQYDVRLHFAETYLTEAGKRVFDVSVNGEVIPKLDVFAAAGGANIAIVKTVPVTVKDGKVTIQFTPIVDQPTINAIEVIPRSAKS